MSILIPRPVDQNVSVKHSARALESTIAERRKACSADLAFFGQVIGGADAERLGKLRLPLWAAEEIWLRKRLEDICNGDWA